MPPLDDVDRIMCVMERAFPPEFGEAWNRRQVADALLLKGTHYGLVAPSGLEHPENIEEPAGFYLARSLLDEEELLLFAVSPEYRRRGLGHQLLQRFIDDAASRGIKKIFLEMRHNNPAGALYAAHGFKPVGIRPRYYRTATGERLDAITQALLIR